MVQVTTDNKQRAAKDVRSAFAHHAGTLASTGSVTFQFVHAGQFLIGKDQIGEEALLEIALESGADDVLASEQGFEVRCNVHAFDKVSHALERNGLTPESAEIADIPTVMVPVSDPQVARTLIELHDAPEELDDVQAVFSNEEVDEVIAPR